MNGQGRLPGWAVLCAYAIGGLGLGVADPLLGAMARQSGLRPGIGTAVSVNLLMPLLVVVLGATRPRFASALGGGLAMTLGFVLGMVVSHPPVGGWTLPMIPLAVPPVLVLACLGYLLLGTLTVLVARTRSDVIGSKG